MKKRFSIIALLLVLVVTFVTFGCKNAEDLNLEDVDKWNDLQVMGSRDYTNSIAIMADNAPIDWWIITDEKGVVLEPNTDYTFKTYDVASSDPVSTPSESCDIPIGQNVCLKFNTDKAIVVWIHQQTVAPKEYTGDEEAAKGTKDFRGRVDIKWADQGYEVKASEYREEVQPVCTIKLTCNETGSVALGSTKDIGGTTCIGGYWSGDYEITEIWPLSQEEGSPQITAESGLKFIFDEDNYIEEGAVRRIVFPANKDIILALCQPNRLTDIERQGTPNLTNDVGKGYYDAIKDFKTNGELHDSLWWCYKLSSSELTAHTEKPMNSDDCNYRFVLTTNTIYEKSALGATYIINESDIVDGSDIK